MSRAIVISDILPLYKEPSLNSEIRDELLYGMIAEVLSGEPNGFVRIRTHYHYEGYALQNGLLNSEEQARHWQAVPKWTVWSPYLDIKTNPAVQARTITSSPRGGLLGVLDGCEIIGDGYIKVGLPDGRTGFVRRPCIAPQTVSWSKTDDSIRAKLVRTAKMYLGVQYRWGGKSPLGIDCSGLTSMAYMLHGILIYRDADIRPEFGMREIPFENKQPGDLIFYKGHTVMYIGNNEIIHATAHPTAEGVVINSFDPFSPVYRGDLLQKVVKTGSIF